MKELKYSECVRTFWLFWFVAVCGGGGRGCRAFGSKQSRPRVQGPHVNAGPIKRNPSLSDPYIPHSILPRSTLARGYCDVWTYFCLPIEVFDYLDTYT